MNYQTAIRIAILLSSNEKHEFVNNVLEAGPQLFDKDIMFTELREFRQTAMDSGILFSSTCPHALPPNSSPADMCYNCKQREMYQIKNRKVG
jgi:hypothetical protein